MRSLLIVVAALVPGMQLLAQQNVVQSGATNRKVESILSQMSLEEKITMLGGVRSFFVPGLARLGIPELGTADSPFGVRANSRSTVYAGGIGLAATWNPALAERQGTELGRDARARGIHFSLGPGVNIYRAPLNGRNFEYYGVDPFLASRIAVGFINGVQSQGVSSTIKHFLGNNSEFARNSSDSRIDERALREIYMPAFEAAAKEAHVGAIMESYNLTNGLYMSENGRLLNDVVKREWGFDGVLMSDWGAVHSALGAATGGVDLEMPGGAHFNRDSLMPLIQQGKVSQADIDDKVRRILRTATRLGWLDRPQLDRSIPLLNERGRLAALQGAREGMVLLKNDRNLLPLSKSAVKSIAVIGPNAYPAVPVGGGSAMIPTFHAVSFLEGLGNHLGTAVNVSYNRGIASLAQAVGMTQFMTAPTNGNPGLNVETFENVDLSGTPANTRVMPRVAVGRALDLGGLATGEIDFSAFFGPPGAVSTRWTGYITPQTPGTYDIFVEQGGFGDQGYRLYVDDKLVRDSWKIVTAIVEQQSVSLDATAHKIVLEHHAVRGFGTPFYRMGIVRQGRWIDPTAEEIAAKADVVVLAVGFDPETESEGWDRSFRLPPRVVQ